MSLTTHLRNPSSPVSLHLARYRPHVAAAASRIAASAKGAPSLPTGFEERYPYGLVGTAIDYRLRWYFSPHADRSMVIAIGRMVLDRIGKLGQLGDALREFVEATPPLRATLSDVDEDTLCRHCVILAVADHLRRGPDEPPEFLLKAKNYGVKRVLASVDDRIVADLVRMSRAFAAANADLIADFRHAWVGGEMEGSGDVEGADVDLLIDGCLYDAKATKHPTRNLADHLAQLLAYVLLDYGDECGIGSVALVLLRQAQTHRVSVEELLGPDTTLPDARAAFLALLRPQGRRKRNRAMEEWVAKLEGRYEDEARTVATKRDS